MKTTYLTAVLLAVAMLVSCNQKKEQGKAVAEPYKLQQTIYHGGDIITMEGEAPEYIKALVEQEGKIVFTGNYKEAKEKYKNAKHVNLYGKTMLPAFLDGHSHILGVGTVSLLANVLPPPDGPGASFESVIKTLKDFKDSEKGKYCLNKFGWIVGSGYDDSQLQEKDHPKATDLDKVSTDLPVVIMHQSGHLGVVNTKGLELLGWTDASVKDPEEGVLRRNTDGTPNGVLEENAFFSVLFKVTGKADDDVNEKSLKLAQESYAKNGYLTVQDGRTMPDQVKALSKAADNGDLYLDVVSYPDMRESYEPLKSNYYSPEHTYKNRFRIGGVKLTLDGSPQGKTAWLTQHYHTPPQGKAADYAGYPIVSDEKANTYVRDAFKNKWQIICHTNGDAAIEQYLNAMEEAQKEFDYDNHRSVIIHGQTIRKDQIKRAASMRVDASLFPMHTFYWGDWHVESVLGHPRADYISPMADAKMAGLNLTSHHDAPVTFPNSMRVLDATVNRVTRSGYVLGPDQRLSVFDGLRTLTTWAAYQYFEEDSKGTLSIGKLADLVILDKNPLKIDPLNINKIQVVESIKEGKTVYKK